ncbi:MAG: hypothetical protein AAFX09_12105 [Pseudomonadota bacterium]
MTGSIRTIALAGAGNIGSRLLQSVAQCDPARVGAIEVYAVEPFEAARQTAKARFDEVVGDRPHTLRFDGPAPEEADLMMAPTDAVNRLAALKGLVAHTRAPAVFLEKFLFTDPAEYAEARRLLDGMGARAWVNCARNVWPGYGDVAERIAGRGPIRLRVTGPDWNMASNAIHFLALMEMLAGEAADAVDASGLDRETRPSKREGYLEVTGLLRATTPSGSSAELYSLAGVDAPMRVEVHVEGLELLIEEGPGILYNLERDGAGGRAVERADFVMHHTSQLAGLFEALLLGEPCALPEYDQSASLHLKTMVALNTVLRPGAAPSEPCLVS